MSRIWHQLHIVQPHQLFVPRVMFTLKSKKQLEFSSYQTLLIPFYRFFFFSVHLRVEDKMNLRIGREGGLQLFELFGLLTLKVADEKYGKIKVQLENNVNKSIQLQTHPNVDKDLFRSANQIGLKNPTKPFPINTDVGVLKWRYQTQDETAIPLTSKLKKMKLKLITF